MNAILDHHLITRRLPNELVSVPTGHPLMAWMIDPVSGRPVIRWYLAGRSALTTDNLLETFFC
jgi:hypothetical protein